MSHTPLVCIRQNKETGESERCILVSQYEDGEKYWSDCLCAVANSRHMPGGKESFKINHAQYVDITDSRYILEQIVTSMRSNQASPGL